MKYTSIIFDLDHTLLDTEQNNKEAIEEVYHYYSFDKYYKTFDEFYSIYLPHNLDLWRKYEQKKVSKDDMMLLRFYTPFVHIEGLTSEKALIINNDYLDRVSYKGKVIDGAFEILDELKPRFPLYILSNGFNEVQYKKMDSAGLTPYFEKIILSDHIGINKPDPALFDYALKEIGTKAEESVMIGDNWNSDIMGAKSAGIDQIWFNPQNESPKGYTPTYTIQKLSEIKDILI